MFFTAAGRQIGSFAVNVIRLTIALPMLGITLLLTQGTDFSAMYAGGNIWFLLLSGLIGLAIGDAALFEAFVVLGPRKTTLMLALVPIITSLAAFLMIGEALTLTAWIGIILTVGGVSWVIAERSNNSGSSVDKSLTAGVILGLTGAICQAVGLVFAKAGMGETVDPLAGTFMRMFAGSVAMWLTVILRKRLPSIRTALGNGRALLFTLGGAICGPFLGVWLSLVSVKSIEAGVAATLMGTTPIWVIPWVRIFFKERTSSLAFLGTIVAMAGIAILFSR